ncbi:class I SAM-dependent DNA methyltransferase [Pseudorhodobacter sp. W20_MBD10_FR17]|uniref:class I SAM-dependent DNA methyltransferase n=1 Tax=Pseudorhodobacter sp. W20_MBD10_FR17 TaxID=3240266 RepID=UPI003F9C7A4D
MTPQEFIDKWRNVDLKERTASHSHFLDLCTLLEIPDPVTADPKGEWFTFEKGASKSSGGEGWADVWRKDCFAWEYKGKRKDLDKAFDQLRQYAIALENPPLLIVSDMDRIRIHTNWTNTVQKVHTIELVDLTDAANRDLLRHCFTDPERLKPAKTRQVLTEEAAQRFATLAQRLRSRGHNPEAVAHFINRLVFCMFAEDVNLLPNKMFERMIKAARPKPETFDAHAKTLFAAMRTGGMVGFEAVEYFNGGLFDSDATLPLTWEDLDDLIRASTLDWSDIDPSIFGTLFERGLDPDKRSQLGAHYTDRDKIMQIVGPVIVHPLLAEWAEVRGKITDLLDNAPKSTKDKLLRGKDLAANTKAQKEAEALHKAFIERLKAFRVLDPACGSGNFLYIALLELKNIEHRANLEAEALGLPRAFPSIGPECVLGIELNPYAAELARVSVWIGEIQWMRRNGFEAAKNPILRTLNTIENRDAVLNADGTRAVWPEADVVVGNPPFLGAGRHLRELGEEYTERLRSAFKGFVPESADLVSYWFAQCQLADSALQRVGLVATNSIRSSGSNVPVKAFSEKFTIFNAWSDLPWVVDGAAVRVSIVCGSILAPLHLTLDGQEVYAISHTLSTDLKTAYRLPNQAQIIFRGPPKIGPFDISGATARDWLQLPTNPNGKANSEVLRPLWIANDIVRRPDERWIIDFADMPEEEAALFERPFLHTAVHVQPVRASNRRVARRDRWWLHGETIPALRRKMEQFDRIIVTPMVSKHRVFVWMPTSVLPDQRLMAICRDDDTSFGVLGSSFHSFWTLRNCSWHGAGNDPVYNAGNVFETFPFPEGLTPNIPAADYVADPRAQKIAAAAARLNELRENWLNPADLVNHVPEVVPGYPDRILPKDEAAAKELKKRTLTNLYNARPAWLDHAHKALDEAVAEAYGWGDDYRAGLLTEDETLSRLFHLNQSRAAAEAKASKKGKANGK